MLFREQDIAWEIRTDTYQKDGLNTIKYTRRTIEYRPLYTWIYADIPEREEVIKELDDSLNRASLSEKLKHEEKQKLKNKGKTTERTIS